MDVSLTVTYSNNTNAGPVAASASFAGDANHTSSIGSAQFTIDKASSTTTISCDGVQFTYTGAPITPCSAVVAGVGGLNQPVPVSYANNIVGTAAASASYAGDPNHYGSNGSATFAIQYAPAGMCFGQLGRQILQPINADGTSVFKQGSTVPAKFRVCDASGNSVGIASVVSAFKKTAEISGTVATTVNENVVSTTPDTLFRWSATDQQWIFNINTKGLSQGKTYQYQIALNDGSQIVFTFGLK